MRLEFARIHYSADTRLSTSSSPQPTGEPGYEARVVVGHLPLPLISFSPLPLDVLLLFFSV